MTWLLTIWSGSVNMCTASLTDSELVAKMKQWAQEQGLRVEIRESESRVWKDKAEKP